jgi:O-antigen/teichoic acid export membrane protein
MRSRLLWRRSATAAGLYASVALGICATIVATRVLGVEQFGVFATALAAAAFFQILLDLTVEDALTKLGFRYIAAEEWGKLHRLFAVTTRLKLIGGGLGSLALVILAPLGEALFGGHDIGLAILAAAPLPLVQGPENVAATALLLRGRYDLRGTYQTLSQGLRLAGIAIGVHYGVVEAILGIVIAQLISTVVVWQVGRAALARFPSAPEEPLTADRAEIIRFVGQSSAATAMVSARAALAPLILGVVAGPTQVGFLRVAQAPQSGYSAASSPVRLILLTEQTRDWEHGRQHDVLRGITRYMLGAGAIALVALPIFLWAMPWLVRIFGVDYLPAVDAARIILVAASIQLVLGWTKSFPTTIGRPSLRIVAHGVETAFLLPLVALLGSSNGVTGAAVATLISTLAFAATWGVLLFRVRGDVGAMTPGPTEAIAP